MRLSTALIAFCLTLSSCSLLAPGEEPVAGNALLIGISDYKNLSPPLNVADDDARDMASLLSSRGWITTTLIDAQATKQGISEGIAELGRGLAQGQRALIYYSGHGYPDSIIPQDYDPGMHQESVYTSAELSSAVSQFASNRVIVIIDACYSGSFVGTGRSLDPTPQNSGLRDEGLERSVFEFSRTDLRALEEAATASGQAYRGPLVISAAGSDELSWENQSNGIFTSYLLEAAESGDFDSDGRVSALEAFAYAKAGVETYWNYHYRYFFDSGSDSHADYVPRVSGGISDLVLFD